MSLTEEQLEELEFLRAKTTPGRWVSGVLGAVDAVPPDIRDDQPATPVARGLEREDAHFVAAVHRALPLLVEEVRRLRQSLTLAVKGAALLTAASYLPRSESEPLLEEAHAALMQGRAALGDDE